MTVITHPQSLFERISTGWLYTLFPFVIGLFLSCSGQTKKPGPENTKVSLDLKYINDSTLVPDQQYQRSVFGFIRGKTFELLSSDTSFRGIDNQWNSARLSVVLKNCIDPTVRNFWLHVVVKDQLENYGIKNTDAIMKTFYAYSSDTASINEIRGLYARDLEGRTGHTIIPYKRVGGFSLDAHIFLPDTNRQKGRRAAIILFHGGSWYQGKPEWVFGSAKRYSTKGLVAIAIEYRIFDRHGTTPLQCVSDAKSAIRWVRKNAGQLGIDPNKIIASGFSAGGHLVACASMLKTLDEADEDTTISTIPNAMIFLSSCFDPTLDPWFVKQLEQQCRPRDLSPNHIVRSHLPPALVIHGTEDQMCPFRTAEEFIQRMREAGNRCVLRKLQGASHFYFFEKKYRDEAIQSEEQFLGSLGFLSPD